MKTSPSVSLCYLGEHSRFLSTTANWLFRQWYDAAGFTYKEAIDEMQLRSGKTMPLAIVARQGAMPVGMASLTEEVVPEQWRLGPFLTGVYVEPKWRRQGVGTMLCRRIEEEARRIGFSLLHLFTEDRVDFYDSLGWSPVKETVTEFGRVSSIVTLMNKKTPVVG